MLVKSLLRTMQLMGCLLLAGISSRAQFPIIPQPVQVSALTGNFMLNARTIILVDSQSRPAGEYFRDYLSRYYRLDIAVKYMGSIGRMSTPSGGKVAANPAVGPAGKIGGKTPGNLSGNSIRLMAAESGLTQATPPARTTDPVQATALVRATGPSRGTDSNVDGAYSLDIAPSGIIISGKGAGVFYGIQSLIQLLPADAAPGSSGPITLPACSIKDSPRFAWRGLSLDVSRHFFSVAQVKKYIDMMAHYKLNVFHWHLTDDEGWRIQIDKYPRLTQFGSRISYWAQRGKFRKLDNLIDSGNDGFYTKEDIRAVIKYAKQHYVTILPEIEMPGHSEAAIFAYPGLGCKDSTGASHRVRMLDPSEHTFTFLQDVLTEVIELFPNDYIHIGGDEAEMADWWKSPTAIALMKKEGLKNEKEVQSYFIRRIEKFLLSKNKKLIGWDEILQGGLAPSATVMSWQGEDGGIAAAKLHHSVVMTPLPYMYFDAPQARADLEPIGWNDPVPWQMVYNYEVFPRELTPEEAHYILGAQANIWTEKIAGNRHLEYMVYPRVLAVAELAWTPKEQKDIHRFEKSMYAQYSLFRLWDLNARLPDIEGLKDITTNKDQLELNLTYPLPVAWMSYHILHQRSDSGYRRSALSSEQGAFPMRIQAPLKDSLFVMTVAARTDQPGAMTAWKDRPGIPYGKQGLVTQTATIRHVAIHAVAAPDTLSLHPGLQYVVYNTSLNNPAALDTVPSYGTGTIADPAALLSLTVPPPSGDTSSWIRLNGYCRIDREADYTISSALPKSPVIYLGGELVIRGNGDTYLEPQAALLHLLPGLYSIRGYFPADRQTDGQTFLTVRSADRKELPAGAYWY